MLSSGNSALSPCPGDVSAEKTDDERASQKFSSQDGAYLAVVEVIPTPHFSIRDYVFASRGKDTKVNWPFPQQFLQHCLDNGVKEVLPPFELPSLVKEQCLKTVSDRTEKSVENSDAVKASEHVNLRDLGVSSADLKPSDSIKDACFPLNKPFNLSKAATGISSEDKNSTANQEAEIEVLEVAKKIGKLHESSSNKNKLTVNLGAILDISLAGDIVSNNSTVSDSMASKVCPVCKAFFSTSNTTLNAHIDQCLSVDSNFNNDLINSPKHKAKLKKKRLLVDIYTTAPHCTLEDLDRRNGTNWASELTLSSAPASEITTIVSKKPKLTYSESRADIDDEEVYVDSNGIKLRILSKFNEIPSSREEHNLRKNDKEAKVSKNCMIKRKKYLEPNFSMKFKMKVQRKESCSFEVLKSQVKGPGDSTLGQWVRSKRSDDPGKLTSNDDTYGQIKIVKPVNRKMIADTRKKGVDFLCSRNKSVEDPIHFPETPDGSPHISSNFTVSEESLQLNFSRSSETFYSSEKKLYVHDKNGTEFDNASRMCLKPSKNFPPLLNDQTSYTSKKNELFILVPRKVEANYKPSIAKKFHKHQFSLPTGKRVDSRTLADQRRAHTKSPGFHIPKRNVCSHQSNKSFRFSAGEIINQFSQNGKTAAKKKRRLYVDVVEDLEEESMSYLPSGAEVQTMDNGLYSTNSENYATKCSGELAAKDQVVDAEIEKSMKIIVATSSHTCPRIEQKQAISGCEAHMVHMSEKMQQCSYEKNMSVGVVGSEDKPTEDEAEICRANNLLDVQSRDHNTGPASIQESSDNLMSCSDLDTALLLRNSTSSSVIIMRNHDPDISNSRDPNAFSASTISLSSQEDTNCINSQELMVRTRSLLKNTQLTSESSKVIDNAAEKVFQKNGGEDHTDFPVKDHLLVNDKMPFCFSCQESLSSDSQLKQRVNSSISKVKKVANVFIGPRTSSPFSSYQNRKIDVSANSSLKSHTKFIISKKSRDSDVNYPTYPKLNSPCTQSQSNSNPVLRLMGKNLVVINSEELVQPPVNTLGYPSTNNQAGFSATNGLPITDNHCLHHQQFLHGYPVLVQAVPIHSLEMPLHVPIQTLGGFAGSQFQGSWTDKPDHQTQPRKVHERTISSQGHCTTDEFIVTDDTSARDKEIKGCITSPTSTLPIFTSSLNPFLPRPLTYFPLQSRLTEVSACPSPLYPNYYLNVSPTNIINQGTSPVGEGPLVPGHIVLQSPCGGPMGSSVYYSQTMQ